MSLSLCVVVDSARLEAVPRRPEKVFSFSYLISERCAYHITCLDSKSKWMWGGTWPTWPSYWMENLFLGGKCGSFDISNTRMSLESHSTGQIWPACHGVGVSITGSIALLHGVFSVLSSLLYPELQEPGSVMIHSWKHICWNIVATLDDPGFQMVYITDFLSWSWRPFHGTTSTNLATWKLNIKPLPPFVRRP